MQPILIRTFPGVADLEFKLSQYRPADVLPAEVQDSVDGVSKTLFDITHNDTTHPEHYEWIDKPEWKWSNEYRDHEDQFEMAGLDDIGLIEELLELNLDFRDDRGHPLRCVMWLRRQAEAAGKRLMGRLPDPAVLAEDKLTADREAFLRARRARSAA